MRRNGLNESASTGGAGDFAELIGPTVGVDEVAEAAGTIGYEILTGLGKRLIRQYVEREKT